MNHSDDEHDDGDDGEGDDRIDEIDEQWMPTAARMLSTEDTLSEFQVHEIEEYYASGDKYHGGDV